MKHVQIGLGRLAYQNPSVGSFCITSPTFPRFLSNEGIIYGLRPIITIAKHTQIILPRDSMLLRQNTKMMCSSAGTVIQETSLITAWRFSQGSIGEKAGADKSP